MRARNKRQAIVMVESLRDVLTERVTCATWGDTPAAPVIRVRPQEVTHGTLVGNLLNAIKSSDVIESIDTGGETTVETENLVVDEGGEGKVVEEVGEVLPDVGVAVLAETLVVKAIYLRNLTRFVVTTEDSDAGGVSDLEGDKESDGLDRVVATIDVITHEKVVGVRIRATNLEEFHQVVKLAVNITTNSDRAFLRGVSKTSFEIVEPANFTTG
jgi:hypothetical protein